MNGRVKAEVPALWLLKQAGIHLHVRRRVPLLALSQENTPSADKSVKREVRDPLVACESPDFGLGGMPREKGVERGKQAG